MAEGHKIVYLLVERGSNEYRKTYWRALGAAYPCRDGSLNLKLDIHPGLTFNIRDPKSVGEREEAESGIEAGNSFRNASHLNDSSGITETDSTDDPFNDTSFICESCKREKPNDEAYALYDGGAVCESCAVQYKSCGRCDYYYPRTVKGTHCPNCRRSRNEN